MNKPNLCDRVQERASLYLDGRLEARVRRRIQEHLKGCEKCVGEYRALRRLSRLAGDMPTARAPRGLARRVRRGLAQRRQQKLARLARGSWSIRVTRRSLAAAAGFLVLLPAVGGWLGYGLGRRDGVAERFRDLELLESREIELPGGDGAERSSSSTRTPPDAVAGQETVPAEPRRPATTEPPDTAAPTPETFVPIEPQPAVPAGLGPRERREPEVRRPGRDELPFRPFEGSRWFQGFEMFESHESIETGETSGTRVEVRVQVGGQRSSPPERRATSR